MVKLVAFRHRKTGAMEILHLVGAKRRVEDLGVKCCDVFIAENDDVVGIDIESVRRKIRRTGEHLYCFVRRLRFLDENLRVGEALEASAQNCAGSVPLLVTERLELIFERVRISMGF